jgi:RNA polymerase sigma-70 factor (ECF subfamily)
MRAANRGNAHAYRELLSKLAPLLRGSARHAVLRLGASAEDVEDIVQETLLAMHLKRHTWVAMARNKLIDHLRRARPGRQHVPIDELGDWLEADPQPSATNALDVGVAIGKLKGRQRDVVVAISIEGQSAREVAQRLGMTEGAVRVVLHRALQSLSNALRNGRT